MPKFGSNRKKEVEAAESRWKTFAADPAQKRVKSQAKKEAEEKAKAEAEAKKKEKAEPKKAETEEASDESEGSKTKQPARK